MGDGTFSFSSSNVYFFVLLVFISTVYVSVCESKTSPSFYIDYNNNTFIKDGKPFRYISGSIHYTRIPCYYWEDRLRKLYAAGLNAIQVLVPWNVHEPEPLSYDFGGQNDLLGFLSIAERVGLLVLLRVGPYICGEWEYGGFPYWLKKNNESIVLRSMDPGYIKPVKRWFNRLLPKLEPLLYLNGGPIIMIQLENEYGSYRSVDCGHDYMAFLRDTVKELLHDRVLLYTTDGAGIDFLKCGTVDGAYATVDFGPGDVQNGFKAFRQWNPKGPLVNSEFYTGWLDHWAGRWSYTSTSVVIKSLKTILDMGANVNMYMFHGGTNFGYMNGANYPNYEPSVTSYDYDSPVTEAGDITSKYLAIRDLIKQYKPVPPDIPKNTTKVAYGQLSLNLVNYSLPSERMMTATYPVPMEQLGQAYGFVTYYTWLTQDIPLSPLVLNGVRDRGYAVMIGVDVPIVLLGKVYRNDANMTLMASGKAGQVLAVLVENMGRINFGSEINHNKKGIIANVTWNGVILTNWTMYSDPIGNMYPGKLRPQGGSTAQVPNSYIGNFQLQKGLKPQDTYLNMCGWHKGVAILNGFNLGHYWPIVGPQVTLYVPKGVLKPWPKLNKLLMVELEYAPCYSAGNCTVKFVDKPILGAKCSKLGRVESGLIREVVAKGRSMY